MYDRSTPTPITKADIVAMRTASNIMWQWQPRQDDDPPVLSGISCVLNATDKNPWEQRHFVTTNWSHTVYSAYRYETMPKVTRCWEWTWPTMPGIASVLDLIRVGDTLTLNWEIDAGSVLTDAAHLHLDRLLLQINRPVGGDRRPKSQQYLLLARVSLNNSARMCNVEYSPYTSEYLESQTFRDTEDLRLTSG